MVTVAEHMNARYAESGLAVRALRKRSLPQWRVAIEGIGVGDKGTNVFEPVRWRRFLSGSWREVQTVASASAEIGSFIRERPDLSDGHA